MTGHEGIKEVVRKNGKKAYQAQVWYDRKFITSKTFDCLALARAFRTKKYEEAVRGELRSAGERRQQREVEAALERPMSEWAELYVKANTAGHGRNRLNEYEQVGRLLGRRTLRDFSGKAGGQLILELADEWRFVRFTRGTKMEPVHSPDAPISDQTLRLRLSALDRLIDDAIERLPDDIAYVGPKMPKDYSPPPAHGNKRSRLPSADEFTSLLKHFSDDGEMFDFLKVVDETGCRLSEVSQMTGDALAFFGAGGQVLGGVLTLRKHKTSAKVGIRYVPLSRYAAQVLHARHTRFGDAALFPGLPVSNDICADFDKACKALGMAGLQIKDFRRGFITRNVRAMSPLELMSVVGQSSLIDLGALRPEDRAVQSAAGHVDPRTTQGYVTPDQQAMAQAFTCTSRWPAVLALLDPSAQPSVRSDEATQLEQEMSELLARMRKLGLAALA